MCGNCDGITIPIGPTGPSGATGIAGTNGTNGTNGINGTDGTSSYKLIKSFTTAAINQQLNISYIERTTCAPNPIGCVSGSTEVDAFVDIHVEVWFFVLTESSSYWLLLSNAAGNNPGGQNTYDCIVYATTGNITVTTGNNVGIFRVVVIA